MQDEATAGCEPIGLTASGEIVFPFRCKDTVERQRAAASKPSEPKAAVAAPAAAREAHQEKAPAQAVVAAKPAAVAPATIKPAAQPAATAAHDHAVGPRGCSLFRSYNAAAGTYLAFDGQRYPCREVAGQPARNQVAGNQPARTQAPHKPSPADIKH